MALTGKTNDEKIWNYLRVNLDHLDLICEALDCSLDELIVRVPNKTPRTTHTINGSQKSKIDE